MHGLLFEFHSYYFFLCQFNPSRMVLRWHRWAVVPMNARNIAWTARQVNYKLIWSNPEGDQDCPVCVKARLVLGKYEKAIEYYEKSLAVFKKRLGIWSSRYEHYKDEYLINYN